MYEFLDDIKKLISKDNVYNAEAFLDALYYYINNCVEIANLGSIKYKLKKSLQLLSTLNK